MKLNAFQKRYLKSLSHHMKPITQIGRNGLSPQILNKISLDLDDHELLKIKVLDTNEPAIRDAVTAIREFTGAEVLRVIGKTAVFYRPNTKNTKPYFKACGMYGNKEKLPLRTTQKGTPKEQ